MKTLLLLLLTGSVAAFGATEERFNKSFALPSGGTLVVDVDFGSISVGTNTTTGVAVDVWRKVIRNSKTEEEKFLRENPVVITTNGTTVTIRSRNQSSSARSSPVQDETEGKYAILVPAAFNARLNTSGGGISVSDLTGDVKAGSSGGGLEFASLRGPLDADTSGGGVNVKDCRGSLKLHTSGGAITVAGGSGSLSGDTSGGGIEVRDFRGPARVKSSGGGITIENVAGKVEGSTSGGPVSAVLPSPLSDSVALSTSGGGMTVRIPATTAFDLDAQTSGGSVSSELPVTTSVVGNVDPDRLKGTVNGGGHTVQLRTSGGGIRVSKL